MGAWQRAGRFLSGAVETIGRAVEAFFGLGTRSRSAKAGHEKRHDAQLEALVREHESGTISRREFEERRRRLPRP